MVDGCADHRRGRSTHGGLADVRVRPLLNQGPGGSPIAVQHVSTTSGHARRQPTRVSARAREMSDIIILAAVACCALCLVTMGASPTPGQSTIVEAAVALLTFLFAIRRSMVLQGQSTSYAMP